MSYYCIGIPNNNVYLEIIKGLNPNLKEVAEPAPIAFVQYGPSIDSISVFMDRYSALHTLDKIKEDKENITFIFKSIIINMPKEEIDIDSLVVCELLSKEV